MLLFMTMYGHIITAVSIDMCSNAGIFTRGYPFTLSGGKGKGTGWLHPHP